MLTDYILDFSIGSLLTGQLLKKMYEHPKELIHCIFSDYSEGVISGLNIKYEGQKLALSKGIYKHNSLLYILEDDTIIDEDCYREGVEYRAIIEEETEEERDNITINHLNIKIKSLSELSEEDCKKSILFSFKNKPSFDDFRMGAYSLLDYKHSCLGKEPTFMPQLFKLVYDKLSSKDVTHPFDYVIMNEILSRGIISCELMRAYIRCCLNQNISDDGKEFLNSRHTLMRTFWEAISKENFDNNEFKKPMQRTKENESCLF